MVWANELYLAVRRLFCNFALERVNNVGRRGDPIAENRQGNRAAVCSCCFSEDYLMKHSYGIIIRAFVKSGSRVWSSGFPLL